MATRYTAMRSKGGISWSALGSVLGGAALGTAMGWSVLIVLQWVTFDACIPDLPFPQSFGVAVVAMGMVTVASLTRVVAPAPRSVWGASLVAAGLAFALSRGFAAHALHAASDCTWLLNPPVPEPAEQGR